MQYDAEEEQLLRSVAIQNARAVLAARERAEQELISAKRALEQKNGELLEQREWFRVTLSSIGDAVITTDTNQRITFINRVAEGMTGWKLEEAIGQPLHFIFNIINEQTREPVDNPITEVLAKGVPVGLANDTALITRDGTENAVEDSAAPIVDGKGNVVGAVMVFHDVTARRKAEAALRSTEQFNRSVMSSTRDCIQILDLEGRLLYMAESGQRLLGLNDLRPLINRFWTDLWSDEHRIAAEKAVRRAAGGETGTFSGQLILNPESPRWWDTVITPMLTSSGAPEKLLAVMRDTTESKRDEETRSRLAAVVESSDDAIFSMTLEAVITTWNKGAEETFGYTPAEAIGRSVAMLIPAGLEDEEPKILERLKRGERIHHYETSRRRKDGVLIDVSLTVSPIYDGSGTVIGVSKISRDITARKTAEAALRRREEELRAMANTIPQLAWMAEPNGHIFWYNQRWYDYTGTTFEDMQGWGWQKVHDSALLPKVIDRWTESIRTGEPFEMEFPLRGVDGQFRWFLTRVNPFRDSEGKILRWFGTNTDIDQERAAKMALQEETRILELLNSTGSTIASQLNLESLVQAVTDAGTQLSGAKFGAFFYNVINAQGEALLLYTLSGAPREAFERFGMPRNTPIFAPTFAGEGVVRSDDITKDPRYGKMAPHHGMPKGHLPVRSYLAVPVTSRSGEAIGGLFFGHPEPGMFSERSERLLVGVAAQAAVAIDNARLYEAAQREITERKRAEEQLSRRIRLAALRAEISTTLATTDPLEQVLNSCVASLVQHLDAAFARIWTINAEEQVLELKASAGEYTNLNGAHSRIKMGEFKIGRIAQNASPHFSNDVPNDPNISDPEWAKERGMVSFAGFPLSVEGKVVGVVAMFGRAPVTEEGLNELSIIAGGLAQWIERKRVQAALQKAKNELELRVLERTSSLQETTEQLETFCYTIAHDLRSPLRAQQSFAQLLLDEYGSGFDETARDYASRIIHSARRLDQLVQDLLAYSKLSRNELKFGRVELSHLLANVRSALTEEIRAQNVTITVAPLLSVQAYEPTLNLVVTNLLINAFKFVKPGVSPVIKIWSERRERFVRVWVEDNGIGISPQHTQKIFGVFQRLHPLEKYPGTGIGLAIVHKGVERMGGRVGVDSELGKGSRFWIELPYVE